MVPSHLFDSNVLFICCGYFFLLLSMYSFFFAALILSAFSSSLLPLISQLILVLFWEASLSFALPGNFPALLGVPH